MAKTIEPLRIEVEGRALMASLKADLERLQRVRGDYSPQGILERVNRIMETHAARIAQVMQDVEALAQAVEAIPQAIDRDAFPALPTAAQELMLAETQAQRILARPISDPAQAVELFGSWQSSPVLTIVREEWAYSAPGMVEVLEDAARHTPVAEYALESQNLFRTHIRAVLAHIQEALATPAHVLASRVAEGGALTELEPLIVVDGTEILKDKQRVTVDGHVIPSLPA